MIKKTFSNGITIEDNRDIGCGVSIINQNYVYFNICYSGIFGIFFCFKHEKIIYPESKAFLDEAISVDVFLKQANKFLIENQ